MKHRYALMSFLLVSCGAFAQQQASQTLQAFDLCDPEIQPDVQIIPTLAMEVRGGGSEPIFYEDFANGLDGNNGFGGWTQTGPHGNIWKKATAGPNGSFVGTPGPEGSKIQSTTVANGYLLFNSDSANSTWEGNTPTILPSAQFTNWEGAIESPVLDLSATPYVQLQFEQRLRWCCSSSPNFVEVSTDGGNTWPASFNTSEGAHMNELRETHLVKVNFSTAIVDDPTNVKFRFRHDSTARSPLYHWQIDDVKLVTQPQLDLKMEYSLVSNVNNGNEYGRIPLSQLAGNTLYVGGGFSNFGIEPHTNVQLEVIGTGPGGSAGFSETITQGDLAFDEVVETMVPVTVPELNTGVHNVTYKLMSDQEPEGGELFDNNTLPTRRFMISNTTYGLDNLGLYPSGSEFSTSLGTNSFGDENEDGIMMMSQYNILQPFTAVGIEVILQTGTNGSQAGGSIIARIHDSIDIFINTTTYTPDLSFALAESEAVIVTNSNLATGRVVINFSQPVTLQPGIYFASVELNGSGENQRIRLLDDLTVPQPAWSSLFYHPTDNRVYTNGNALAVRLMTVPNVSIQEHAQTLFTSMSPNPTNGLSQLTYVIDEAAPVTIDILDITGKHVMSMTEGNRSQGRHQTWIDASMFQDGVYLYVVRVGDREATGRFVVVK